MLGLGSFLIFTASVTAQIYDEESGATVYERADGGVVVYQPTAEGGNLTVCGPDLSDCYSIDCTVNRKQCAEELDKASMVQSSNIAIEATKQKFTSQIIKQLRMKKIISAKNGFREK